MATLKMTRGDTPTFRVGPVQRPDENDVLQDVDLTGASGTMTVRDKLVGGSVLFTVAATFDTVNAFVLCQPLEADTADATPGNYVYDVQVEESDGTITTFPEKGHGKLRIQRGVTE
jgi:hypothetical protein